MTEPGGTESSRHVVITVGEAVAVGGDAIGRMPDGRTVLVEGALPGETVDAVVTVTFRDYARARVERVRDGAPMRTEPACPNVAAGCGGCGWAHVAPAAQGALARRVVVDALQRIGRVAQPPVEVGGGVDPVGYRTTVTAGVGPGGRLGYHRRHCRDLVTVELCRIAHPRVADLLGRVRAPGWDSVTLRAGIAGGERLAVVRARGHPGRPPEGVPPDVTLVMPGQDAAFHEEVGGRRWRVSARSFFQSGPQAAALLVDAVERAVGDAAGAGRHVVDAYCGVGLLGGVVAGRRGARLTSIESNPGGAADARHNLADLDATVVRAQVGQWDVTSADVVVADPARPGLGRPGAAAVTATGAPVIVLVSCDPASLARDTRLLAAAGYRLAAVEVVGVFPDTVHVETVTTFRHVRAAR